MERNSDLTSTHRRIKASAAIGLMLALILVVPPAVSQEANDTSPSEYSAMATASAVHVDVLEFDGTKLENTDIAFSSAATDSQGLAPAQLNEMDREIHPALPDQMAYGRGSGLEVGLAVTPEDDNQIVPGGTAEASAPPSTDLITEELLGLDLDPLVYAELLRGQAQAQWRDDACIVGSDSGFGLGSATDVQLLGTGGDDEEDGLDEPLLSTSATDPERATSESTSRTLLIGQRDADGTQLGDNFGILAENRQTFAPVTLFKDTPNEFTIEVLGEWVLQAVATGEPGGAYIHYGPEDVSPNTTVVRIRQGGVVVLEITAQQILDDDGVTLDLPGLAEITVGEPPRAIGGPAGSDPTIAADGTEAAAAVDVVRVQLLDPLGIGLQTSDIRIGHMEASAEAPEGGIVCEMPVEKDAVSEVEVGDTFDVSIPVTNTYDCTIENVRLVDEITTGGDATFTVLDTDPQADEVPAGEGLTEGTIVWDDLGSIAPGETLDVTVTLRADSGPGEIFDIASVSATIGDCPEVLVGGADVAATGAGVTAESDELRVAVVEEAPPPPDDEIDVSKSADQDSAQVGDEVTFTITVDNTFDCTLQNVEVTDHITVEGEARFQIVDTDPEADQVNEDAGRSDETVVWQADDIDPGESATFAVTIQIQGGSGTINDVADASATLADCEGEDEGRDGEDVDGTSEPVGVEVEGDELVLDVSKRLSDGEVIFGQQFDATITLQNTFDCVLQDVVMTDEIWVEGDALFVVVDTSPQASQQPVGERSQGTVVWSDLGPVQPGEMISVTVTVEARGGVGEIHDRGRAEATLADCEGEDEALSGVGAAGVATGHVQTAEVMGELQERAAPEDSQAILPVTGADIDILVLWGLGLVMVGAIAMGTSRYMYARRPGAYWEGFSI